MAWTPARGRQVLEVVHLLENEMTVFRVVDTSRRGDDNFRSAYELGAPPPRRIQLVSTPIWMALSTLTTLDMARSRARAFPVLGNKIAEMHLQAGLGFALAETIEEGHVSVWGDPVKLRASVVDVYPLS